MTEIYRGDIYYIMPFYTVTGSEQRAGRPGVVVSNDITNRHSPNVEIVFLTSQEKKPLPTHVPVMCRVPSTALCENIQTVSKERLSTFIKSCSTMHKIAAKEFELSDFSTEHLVGLSIAALQGVLDVMNLERKHFLVTHDKDCWWQMIQLLPSSYNQRRTVTMTYENVMNMLDYREGHKLDEWREFCEILRAAPHVEVIRNGK